MNALNHPGEFYGYRRSAEAVRKELAGLVELWTGLPADHPVRPHALFAELYLCTTSSWLARQTISNEPEFLCRVICLFFDHYRAHVVDRLSAPLTEIVPHWRPYHVLARRMSMASSVPAEMELLLHGVKAHVLGDLGRAVASAEREFGEPYSGSRTALRASIFGAIANEAFFDAAMDFFDQLHARSGWRRRWSLALYRGLLIALKPHWLRRLQSWRQLAVQVSAAKAM